LDQTAEARTHWPGCSSGIRTTSGPRIRCFGCRRSWETPMPLSVGGMRSCPPARQRPAERG
jgi:hypothetical protein